MSTANAQLHPAFTKLMKKYGVEDPLDVLSSFMANNWFSYLFDEKHIEAALPVEALELLLENSTQNESKLKTLIEKKGNQND